MDDIEHFSDKAYRIIVIYIHIYIYIYIYIYIMCTYICVHTGSVKKESERFLKGCNFDKFCCN